MKRDRDRPFTKQIIQAPEAPLLVWQQEWRHCVTNIRCCGSDISLHEPIDLSIYNFREIWTQAPHFIGEGLEPVSQRGFEVAAANKCLLKDNAERTLRH
jgi:hypothetical protein